MSTTGLPLATLTPAGSLPQSRLNSPGDVADLVQRLIRADESRASARARVKGLVDGNAPYNPRELRNTGQSFRTNINFRESEAFLASATGAFYDVFSEVPHYATVAVPSHDLNLAGKWSAIATEEFDQLQRQDYKFDYTMQLSQHEMVLYGTGPLVFEDGLDWRCKAVHAADLLLPDGAPSNVSDWSVAVIRARYQVHELYAFIKNEEAARKAGWDVAAARKAIAEATPENLAAGRDRSWEWHQQQIRNNDLSHSARCDVIRAAHVLYREFPDDEHPEGAISHCIILEGAENEAFLYRRVNRYHRWHEAVHVMYYDKGDGQHHSVKGMGVKMYSALELKNRLTCSLVDSAFARTQILFQPTTPDSLQKTNVVQMGPYAVMPPGYNVVQTAISGVLDAPMAVGRELEMVLQSNLSQYRQRIEKPGGNPRTATEITAIMAQQATLGKTQLSRYYEQLDALFAERYRRATSSNLTRSTPGGEQALEFQRRCVERGVPVEAIRRPVSVKATRTIGQGSAAMRQHVVSELLGVATMLPESGRRNLLADMVASRVGQQQVARYIPEPDSDPQHEDQVALAMLENAALKDSAPVLATNTQLHAVHLQAHLQAGAEAAQAVEGGAVDPVAVASFLHAIVAHGQSHLDQLSKDPTRKAAVGIFVDQLTQLAEVSAMLTKQVQQQPPQSPQAPAPQEQMDTDEHLAVMRAQRDEARRDAKLKSDLARKEKKARQDLAIKDAKAASALSRP